MKSYESEGRTVEEAINTGLEHLNACIGDVDIKVLNEGSKGLFGLFGSRLAKVSLTLKKEENIQDATRALFQDALDEEGDKEASKPKTEKTAKKEAPVKKSSFKEATSESKKDNAEAKPVEPAVQRDPESPEGIAQSFLQKLTSLMGLDVQVHADLDEDGSVRIVIQGDPRGILIGRRGETLDALQYLTGLQVNADRENYIRVTLDSEGYRAKREESLKRLANRMANRVKKTGRKVRLEPMNPYERRIIHSAVQGIEGVNTHSEGEDPNRKIVITLDKRAKQSENDEENNG
ncbi:MAG: RNA-binding cell elongation regulator Jag/EloR [Eubacteriales bacterium]|nr:RNA-binding cell elongation regulator Jag/EloR [Eubacteriales bacterium]